MPPDKQQHDSSGQPHSSGQPSGETTRRLTSEESDVVPASELPHSDAVPQRDASDESNETTPWHGDQANYSETARPPSMPKAVSRPRSGGNQDGGKFGERLPDVGETIDDFELLQELGRGAMGVVFLARQISLGRQVALKVSKNIGDEAQTMAAMEHRHIVQVYSESIIAEGDQRLLCMQFVPGVTLEKVIKSLRAHSGTPMNGRRFIDIVDDAQKGPALLDPEALHDRLLLTQSSREEVVCRVGIWLSEALEYAHRRGVLHRDIKPANILVDPYGHPRLADFSLSALSAPDEDAGDALFGGTLNYMAPEHLLAFVHEMDEEDVDQRSDLYGLALVLYELLTLKLPTVPRDADESMQDHVRRLVELRLDPPPPIRTEVPEASAALDRTLNRCLDPDPACRYQSAVEFGKALRGCLQLKETEKSLPRKGGIIKCFKQWPVWSVVFLTLLPHLAGSVFNIAYNGWIVERFQLDKATFNWLVVAYNLVVYPPCIFFVVKLIVLPALHLKRVIEGDESDPAFDIDAARRRSLNWPLWAAILACFGWFPGMVFFPLGLSIFSPPGTWEVTINFWASILISGLIALTYSVVGLQLITLRYYYPQLWDQVDDLQATARRELRRSRRFNYISQILAGLIPLLGGGLCLIVLDKELKDDDFLLIEIIILSLIFTGFGGFQIAYNVGGSIRATIDALTGRDDDEHLSLLMRLGQLFGRTVKR